VHQGPGDRLLHADRAGPAAAPPCPAADAQALPERRRGEVLLREALPGAPAPRRDWGGTRPAWSGPNEGDTDFCLCEDLPTMVWLANLADLELHTPMARAPEMDDPTMIAFDLDPGPPADIVQCAQVALELRRAFEFWDLQAFPK